ncbi:hypothetical protein [Falsiroseomonas sp.]|uniref:hypothetical protein n=1 Tax=Falsiroseomonas sp. TaxID=2870721 RepID=UPI0027219DE1|nr:hypothetical protein [Falsiroseomonas sp.]MDO9502991.1 hypothetical protein [Falsiroseomonas sp.]
MQAAEMVLIRLAHVAELPPPADLIRQIREGGPATSAAPVPAARPSAPSGPSGGGSGPAAVSAPVSAPAGGDEPPPWVTSSQGGSGGAQALRQPQPDAESGLSPNPQSYEQAVALFSTNREVLLQTELEMKAHLVRFEPGRIELRLEPTARPDLANQVGRFLTEWTGQRWVVSLSNAPGAPSLTEQRQAVENERLARAGEHPYVQSVKQHFPGAVIADVRVLKPAIAPPVPEAALSGELESDVPDDLEEED